MRKLLSHSRRVFCLAAISYVLFMHVQPSAHAATSCDPQGGITTVGLEWVAKQCIPDGVSDNTSIYYINNALECSGGNVTLFAPYGDTQGSPASLINYWKSQGYRVFRNKEGSHIVAVHRYYTGLIDGKSMSNYTPGQVYTDVFSEGFILPSPTPDCQGGDFNCGGCPCEQPANSTANLGTGRLSHDQDLFALKNSQSLSLSISLYYRSIQFAPSAIGNGWSHSYEMALQTNSNGSVTFWMNGTRRIYTLYSNVYYPPKGDYSALVKNGDGTYTLTEKDGLKHNFNASGNITSMVDRNGNTLAFTYAAGKLTTVTDPNGRSAILAYDSNNKLSTVTDPKGNVYTFTYTGGTLTSVTNPDGSQWKYTYGTNGLFSTKTDPENNQASYAYDSNKRLTSTTDPESKTRSYAFPPVVSAGKIPDPYPVTVLPQKQFTFTEKDGGGWTYTFDTRTEKISKKVDPLGNAYTYTYDKQGNMLTKTEPGIGTTTYTYDSKGNILSAKDPLNQTTNYTYNNFAEILTVSGAPGKTTYTYDARGNLLTTTDPAGALTQYGYDSKGNLTTITDPRSNVTTLTYDANNNVTSVTLPTGAVTRFTYDANGNLLTKTDAANKVTTLTYDTRNRLVTVTDPLGNVTTYAYNNNGNLKTVTDANNNVTANTYNYLGQLTASKDALGSVTSLTYGVAGCPTCTGVDQLTAITDAKNQKTSWTYDKLGRLLAETGPISNSTMNYAYGPLQSPSSKTDANGATIGYAYDALERLTQKTYPDSSSVTYTYDSRNNILSATNKDISYTFVYDNDNRVTSVSDSRGYSIAYQYDQAGNRTQVSLQPGTLDQRTTTYVYDNRNRLQTITAPTGAFTIGYDLFDRRTSLVYPNQVTTSYGYDEGGRLTTLTHATAGSPIATFAYTYDKVGNRLTKTGTTNESYGYDAIYRLLQANIPQGTENFTYDAVGNRLTGPGPKDSGYLYNAANEMTRGRKLAYGYDNNGNQTTRTVPNAPDRSWTQTWDYENRLIKVEKIKGTERKTITFTYDPFNRRIGKQLTTVIDGQTKTYTWTYVYDNNSIALEAYTDSTGAVTKTWYTEGPGIDEHLALERKGSSYYYHADGLGSIIDITDAGRNIVQNYTYDSFGMVKPSTGFVNSYTYTGREWDPQAGLYFYRARYYDPMEGRFISKDPIGFRGGGVNPYRYVENNPVNQIDPTGLLTIPWPRTWPITWPKLGPLSIGGPIGLAVGIIFTSTPTASPCDDEDPCIKQWMADTEWCDQSFTGRLNVACHSWALEELYRCKDGEPRQPFRW